MPNWCNNSLVVSGPKADQDSFYEAIKHEGDFRLIEAFLPASEYHSTLAGYNDGGYEWCIATWGTKWPESELQVDYKPSDPEDHIGMTFETAWAPPLKAIEKIATLFPTLEFRAEWYELGMQFCGAAIYHGDKSVLVDGEFSQESSDDEDEWLTNQEIVYAAVDTCVAKAQAQFELVS